MNMSQHKQENKELRTTKLEEEINEAKEHLWELMQEEDLEKINNEAAYIRYLETKNKGFYN